LIAISYRREDTAPITGRIYDRLQAKFGRDRVFLDFDSIPFGVDFRTHISESLNRSDTLLVIIGPHWSGVSPDGSRRIDDPTDFVRLEVAQALAGNIRVVPLLIDRTDMPSSSSLPEDLKSLAFRNALRVDSGADFHHHIDRLCDSLQPTPSSSTPTVSGSSQPKMPEKDVKQVRQGHAGRSGYDGVPSKRNLPKKRIFSWVVAIIAVVAVILAWGTLNVLRRSEQLKQQKLAEQKRPTLPEEEKPQQSSKSLNEQPQTNLQSIGQMWAVYGEQNKATLTWDKNNPYFEVQGRSKTSVPEINDTVTALANVNGHDGPTPVWDNEINDYKFGPHIGDIKPGDKAVVLVCQDVNPPTWPNAYYVIRLSRSPKK